MDKKEFIEIVNWEKAQPLMKGENNPWLKMYTSVLDNDCIEQLDDRSYRLATYLWALAARMGTKYLRADTDWLKRRMATFPGEPDLEPLMNVKDIHGKPAPFIRYCDAPGQEENSELSSQESVSTHEECSFSQEEYNKAYEAVCALGHASARGIQSQLGYSYNKSDAIVKCMKQKGLLGKFIHKKGFALLRAQSEESRIEEKKPYRVSGEQKRKNPIGFKNPTAEAQRQREALLKAEAQDNARKPVNPTNPIEPDESAVSIAFGRTQPTSSFRGGNPQSLGKVIKGDFKPHICDSECREFGEDVADALGLPGQADEVGNFAMWLWELKGMCGSSVVADELKEYMLKKARWVNSNKCKGKRNKGALLRSIMAGALAKRGIRMPDKRASPA